MAAKRRIGGLKARTMDVLWRRARSGNGKWLAAAIVVSGLRLLVRISRREREVVFSGELAPGEELAIRHTTRSYGEDNASADQM
ncbi:hypothetical protein [Candidatus Poriferisodalis sp.]|uniref:hypothetical protein n=1 Tax=Candidatus Poriferisodalis sp. TaxID=3101277 RepID=UPI003AF91A57